MVKRNYMIKTIIKILIIITINAMTIGLYEKEERILKYCNENKYEYFKGYGTSKSPYYCCNRVDLKDDIGKDVVCSGAIYIEDLEK